MTPRPSSAVSIFLNGSIVVPWMKKITWLIVASMLSVTPMAVLPANTSSDVAVTRAFRAENASIWLDVPVYIVRLYAERFFAALGAECPRAGVGRAPGAPAATLYASTPTMLFNPSYAMAVQVLKTNEIARYLDATQAEKDAREFAKVSGCNPIVVKRVTSDMRRHLSDRQWAGPSADTLAAQCKSRPNRWDASPCDCIGKALDMASTPRSRQLLMSDLWGWMENLIDGDSRLYNLSMVACTKTALRTDVRKPSYVRTEKFLNSSSNVIRTAISTMITLERITLPTAVARPLYEHAAPLWAEHGEPTRLLACYYGSNSQAADTFVVLFWQNTVFLSRADFAAISPRHPLMLVSEMVRKTCPGIDEAKEIRAANHREARKLGYH